MNNNTSDTCSTQQTNDIQDALDYISSDCDRDTWVKVAMSIHSDRGPGGWDIFNDWSKAGESYNEKDAHDTYKSIRPNPNGVKIGTLYHLAKSSGWPGPAGGKLSAQPVKSEEQMRQEEERARQEEYQAAKRRAKTAQQAEEVCKQAVPAKSDNPYLARKQVAPAETSLEIDAGTVNKILGYPLKANSRTNGADESIYLSGRLLVNTIKQGDKLSSLEFVDGAGSKTALFGSGTKTGGHWEAQPLPDDLDTLLIGEGVATVLTAKEVTGLPVVASLTDHNLPAIAKSMRKRYPGAAIIILADLVKKTGEPDPKAVKAAQAVGGRVAIPDFWGQRPEGMTDFNDQASLHGLDSVKTCLDAVVSAGDSPPQEHEPGPEDMMPEKKKLTGDDVRRLVESAANMDDADYAASRSEIKDKHNITLTLMDKMRDKKIKERAEDAAAEEAAGMPAKEIAPAVSTDEFSLAKMVTDKHSDLKYVGPWGKWMVWDGKVWEKDEYDITLDAIHNDLLDFTDIPKGMEKAEVARVKKQATISAVERICRGKVKHRSRPEEWDSHDWLLNTPDSIVNLRTGQTQNHNPDLKITMSTRVAPGGECPIWNRFLDQITNNNKELVDYLQRLMGYCLTGSVEQQMFAFLHGAGANGKGTFLGTIQSIMGPYAGMARSEILLETFGRDHPAGEAVLMGRRLVVTGELSGGKGWDEGRVKSLTGGDRIQARFMRGDFFEFSPHFKLVIAGNHKPSLKNVDEAMARRLHLVPFDVVIPKEKRDPKLPYKLKNELGGILSWMIEGCGEYVKNGLQTPAVVAGATNEYFNDENTFSRFVEECCVVGDSGAHKTLSSRIYKAWQFYCETNGEKPGSNKAFSKILQKNGYKVTHSNKGNCYDGIDVSSDFYSSMPGQGNPFANQY